MFALIAFVHHEASSRERVLAVPESAAMPSTRWPRESPRSRAAQTPLVPRDFSRFRDVERRGSKRVAGRTLATGRTRRRSLRPRRHQEL